MTTLTSKVAAKSWSSTLHLPKSSFPPRPAPSDLSAYIKKCTDDLYKWQWQEDGRPTPDVACDGPGKSWWEGERAVSPGFWRRKEGAPFILHDGPPYANGDLHAGHALNKILKDMICRTKFSGGRRVRYVPGWDCHGLPIELKALERHGWTSQQKSNPVAIRQAARNFANEAVQKQMQGFKSWGIMADWSNHWKTMDKDYELRQLAVFRSMATKGLIYRKHKPVYWSPSSQTALAEAELEYKEDHSSTAALVKFPIVTSANRGNMETTYALVWTTTPWTIPANQAIAFKHDLQYSRVRSPTHGLLLFAKARVSYVESLLGEQLQIVDEHFTKEELASMAYEGPRFLDSTSSCRPFFDADFVTAETGTGLVHCAPGHGMEDYEALLPLIREGKVEAEAPVDDSGLFTKEAAPSNPGLLVGKEAFKEGNDLVLNGLLEEGLLLNKHHYKHKYPYDWRTKQPIMIRSTAQWFADVSSIKEDTLLALDDVVFKPQTGKSRLRSFIENRNEWCISRQRAWGVPIPAIFHKEKGDAILSDESISHIVKVIEERGIDAWWSDDADDAAWIVPSLSAAEYRRGTDTMDVWFDSGTSWTNMLDENEQLGPEADIYIEGTDQHRGWFQSSLLTIVAYQKSVSPFKVEGLRSPVLAPYRALITHGFTLDGDGKKMSKSIGNVVSPDEIISGILLSKERVSDRSKRTSKIKQHQLPLGPDALRLWVASSDWTKDVIVSDTIIQTVHSALHKYRVTFKMLLGALQDFSLDKLVDYPALGKVNQMALYHLCLVAENARAASDHFEFYKAVTAINRWVNAEFSGLYMEASKDILYCDAVGSHRRLSVQTVLYHILCQMQNMLGPLLPILVEETWAHTPLQIQEKTEHPLQRVWAAPSNIDGEPAPNFLEIWADPAPHDLTMELPLVMAVNTAVKSAQEKARSAKQMGSSLESDVELHLNAACEIVLHPWLKVESDNPPPLQDLLVVSRLEVFPIDDGKSSKAASDHGWQYMEKLYMSTGDEAGFVVVRAPANRKCARCWKFTVEAEQEEDMLCTRCQDVVDESSK